MRLLKILSATTVFFTASALAAQSPASTDLKNTQTSVQQYQKPILAFQSSFTETSGITNVAKEPAAKSVITPTGPGIDAARAGITTRAEATKPGTTLAPITRPRAGQAVALMVVGGAALVTGLIVGDDAGTVIAVGGLVVGLVGLYQYVK